MRQISAELEAHRPASSGGSWIHAACLLLALAAAFIALSPEQVFIPGNSAFILTIGGIGLWRYGWGGLQMIRALAYRHILFPRLRRAAEARGGRPPHVAIVVMSWRMSAPTNAAVYGAVVDELTSYGVPATIVASLSDPADTALLENLVARAPTPIHLITLIQDGTGKRRALVDALEKLRSIRLPRGCVVALMDGDTWLPIGALAGTVPLLLADPMLGAVTTNNRPLVAGRWQAREWYRLRMAQRHLYMCSMSLSRRVLVLTGRFSVFRSEIALHADFAATVGQDGFYHPRLGRISMLTGEDKSTWFWTLKLGWRMLYLPDVVVYPLEKLPRGWFVPATSRLMLRWFGNMVRSGTRVIKLGPKEVGLFPWIALVDQRVSMWTALTGPVFFALAAAMHDIRLLAVYGLWVLGSRTLYGLLLSAVTGTRWHPAFGFLLYYTQVIGAAIKIFATFHPYLQSWTRQGITLVPRRGHTVSWLLLGMSACLFVGAIAWAGGVFNAAEDTDPDETAVASADQ